jgi:hypothetical protein
MLLRSIVLAGADICHGQESGASKRLRRQPFPAAHQLPELLKRFSISAAGI